jgi:hypothetical protein
VPQCMHASAARWSPRPIRAHNAGQRAMHMHTCCTHRAVNTVHRCCSSAHRSSQAPHHRVTV